MLEAHSAKRTLCPLCVPQKSPHETARKRRVVSPQAIPHTLLHVGRNYQGKGLLPGEETAPYKSRAKQNFPGEKSWWCRARTAALPSSIAHHGAPRPPANPGSTRPQPLLAPTHPHVEGGDPAPVSYEIAVHAVL